MSKTPFRLLCFLCASILALIIMPDVANAGAPPPPAPQKVGDVITNLHFSLRRVPNILTTIAFVSGLFLAVSGVLKLKEHVDNPNNTPISAGIKRLIAGGFFIALPLTTNMLKGTLFGTDTGEIAANALGWNVAVAPAAVGLDQMAIAFITNFAGPMKFLMISFSYISGLAFILIGISRLIKTAQEGPRGPAGMGTLVTFLTGSALMTLGQSLGTMQVSLFGSGTMENYVTLSAGTQAALNAAEEIQLQNVIGAVLMFVSVVGIVAFVRGLYVLKAVADGNQQVSLTQAFTFLIGGAMAVNLGAVVNMIQNTIGAGTLGFSFS